MRHLEDILLLNDIFGGTLNTPEGLAWKTNRRGDIIARAGKWHDVSRKIMSLYQTVEDIQECRRATLSWLWVTVKDLSQGGYPERYELRYLYVPPFQGLPPDLQKLSAKVVAAVDKYLTEGRLETGEVVFEIADPWSGDVRNVDMLVYDREMVAGPRRAPDVPSNLVWGSNR